MAMTKMNPHTHRQARGRRRFLAYLLPLQTLVLVLILGFYVGLFELLPRADAWRKEQASNMAKNDTGDTTNTVSQRIQMAWLTPMPLKAPNLPPLAITPVPLTRITPPPLRVNPVRTQSLGAPQVQASHVEPNTGQAKPVPIPSLPPVQIQPLPTLAPLPPVAAPVIRSRGS